MHLSQDHILEVASFISPRVPRPSVSRLEAGGAEIPLTSFLPSAHTVESTSVLGNGEISGRELPFDCSSWNYPSHLWHWWTLYWIHSQKKLINHTPMVEINVQLLEDNLIENGARDTERQKRNCKIWICTKECFWTCTFPQLGWVSHIWALNCTLWSVKLCCI